MASPKTRDDIDRILSGGIDLKKRRIYFGNLSDDDEANNFTWGTVEHTIRLLHALADNSNKSIELHMCSPGGETSEMFRLYDAIQKSPCQVKFFGSGQICSSASLIMAGCDERYLDKHTQIMLHKGSGGVSGYDNETDIQISAKHNTQIAEAMCKILADNSKMSEEYWNAVMDRDLYLTADEAIALGLADKVSEYKKRGNLRRVRIANMNKKVDEEKLITLLEDINKRIHVQKHMKVELSIPKERHDKDVYVDDSPVTDEEAGEASSYHNEEPESQDS